MDHTIIYEGIAIISNPDLVLPSLLIEQVSAIFAGDIANYSEFGGPEAEIVFVFLGKGSELKLLFGMWIKKLWISQPLPFKVASNNPYSEPVL